MDDESEFFDAEDTFQQDEPTRGNELSLPSEPGTPAGQQPLDSVAPLATPSPRSEEAEPYPLHRCAATLRRCRPLWGALWLTPPCLCSAVFSGDVHAVDAALDALPQAEWSQLDSVGNSALHVAVLCAQPVLVERLLSRGFPVGVKSAAGWGAVHYAILQRDVGLTRRLHTAQVRVQEQEYRQRKPQLLAELAALPDFRGCLRWEFCSPVFAPLLRRFAPHDTYVVTKRGACLRVDGTLKGLLDGKDAEGSLIPQWDRGAFSLLFDGQSVADAGRAGVALPSTGARQLALWLVDRDKGEVVDALPPNEARTDASLMEEADQLLAQGALKSKLRATDFSFAPARNWRGQPRRETVEGWPTVVFETKGQLQAQTLEARAARRDTCQGTFEQYLASEACGGATTDVMHDLGVGLEDLAMHGEPGTPDSHDADPDEGGEDQQGEEAAEQGSPSTPPQGATRRRAPSGKEPAGGKPAKPRAFRGTVWMAEGHPLSVRALFPLLDVCASVNKHLAKVRRFLAKWADVDACPVRLQVPLFMTVYAQVAFRDFELLTPADAAALPPDFFTPPPHFRVLTLDEKLDAMEARMAEEARMQGEEEEGDEAAMRAGDMGQDDDAGDHGGPEELELDEGAHAASRR
jgi:hypothetical protein